MRCGPGNSDPPLRGKEGQSKFGLTIRERVFDMSNKKPAHEVVVEMIRETIERLDFISNNNPDSELYVRELCVLAAEVKILERMAIPEKYHKQIAEDLYQIRSIRLCWPKDIAKLLKDAILLIAPC